LVIDERRRKARYIAEQDACMYLRATKRWLYYDGLTTYNYQSFGLKGVGRRNKKVLGCEVFAEFRDSFFDSRSCTLGGGKDLVLALPGSPPPNRKEQPGCEQVTY